MTLRDLSRLNFFPLTEEVSGENISIAFAVDYNYLPILKVALRSLAMYDNFPDSPIIIYTDDARVAEDPIVKLAADRVQLLEGDRKEILYRLARDSVKRPERAEWNKGTFLKWMCFEKQATEKVLFLDVDMIFLRKFDVKLMRLTDRDFCCCPQFSRDLLGSEADGQTAEEKQLETFQTLINGKYFGRLVSSVNSGMMVLQGEVLTNNFFEQIVEDSLKHVAVNEQSHFTRYFRERGNKRRMLPYSFNFQEGYFRKMSWVAQRRLLNQIDVLHYAGPRKPWQYLPISIPAPSSTIWHWHRTAAEKMLNL